MGFKSPHLKFKPLLWGSSTKSKQRIPLKSHHRSAFRLCVNIYILLFSDPANIWTKKWPFAAFHPWLKRRGKLEEFSQGRLNNASTNLNLNSQGHTTILFREQFQIFIFFFPALALPKYCNYNTRSKNQGTLPDLVWSIWKWAACLPISKKWQFVLLALPSPSFLLFPLLCCLSIRLCMLQCSRQAA